MPADQTTTPKIKRTTGMAARAGAGLAERRAAREVQQLVPTDRDGSARTTSVSTAPLDELADNPRNDPKRLADVSDLASIGDTAIGILLPLLVTPRESYLAAHPQFADPDYVDPRTKQKLGPGKYVILAGHRRKKAAAEYGLTEVPIYVRDDLMADGGDAKVRILENLKRLDLDPIGEALEYQLLRDEHGVKVRAMADDLGFSHSHIVKRLGLLSLPAPLQEALAAGGLKTTYAERIGSSLEQPAGQLRAWQLLQAGDTLGDALVYALHEDAATARLAQLTAEAEPADDPDDPDNEPLVATTPAPHAHTIQTTQASAQGESTSSSLTSETADAVPAQRTAAVSSTSPAGAAVRPAVPANPTSQAQEAAGRRFQICQQLAAVPPSDAEAVQPLARHSIQGAPGHRDAVRLAHRWLRAAGVGPVDLTDPTAFMAAVTPTDLVHVAYVIALAADETRARDPKRPWDRRDLAHLDRLREAGYTPTDWEKDRLAAITR